jgi:hypothetical protein
MIHTFLSGAGANGASPVANVDTDGFRGMYGIYQLSFGGTGSATVTLQGKLSADHDWTDIDAATADKSVEVTFFPLMRVNVSGLTGSPTILASIICPKAWT